MATDHPLLGRPELRGGAAEVNRGRGRLNPWKKWSGPLLAAVIHLPRRGVGGRARVRDDIARLQLMVDMV